MQPSAVFQKPVRRVKALRNFLKLNGFRDKLLEKKISSFQPKIVFRGDVKNYRLMTASYPSDLKEILKLRHKIFVDDLGREPLQMEVDFDRYDLLGDHIVIIDKRIDKIIGTYRVISSQFSKIFYSESEFNMAHFKSAPDRKLELGRACIHEDYRNGIILHLMWKGLARYIHLVQARYLFGCSSVFVTEPNELQQVLHQFSDEEWGDEFHIAPKAKYQFPKEFKLEAGETTSIESKKAIPVLLQGYMRAGAKVYGQPAWDREFGCADVFTILDMEKITPAYWSKYFEHLQ